jgi:hypothetical protein
MREATEEVLQLVDIEQRRLPFILRTLGRRSRYKQSHT